MSRVSIVVLNWNNWPDTLECLESLLRLDYLDYRIVICDNGSTDDSLNRIRSWAAGCLEIIPEDRRFPKHGGSVRKPFSLIEYDRLAAESGGDMNRLSRLVMIRNGENLGFAGGCNVGLRYILARRDSDYVWILNNDTVVAPEALKCLVARVNQRPDIGICGSTVLSYWRPREVDALGGAFYSRWTGMAWHLGRWRDLPGGIDPERVERRMDYVVGSSMFVSIDFLGEVGLLDESFFLYFEELDWALRGNDRFALGYAPGSVVYHKGGRSIGTATHPARKSMICDYYTLRNRIKFTRQRYPYALPAIYLGLVAAFVVRLVFGEWQRALMVLRLMVSPHLPFEECAR